jgi:hypothetical protein
MPLPAGTRLIVIDLYGRGYYRTPVSSVPANADDSALQVMQ